MCFKFKFNYYSLNNSLQITELENKIFKASFYNFESLALDLFTFQYHNNVTYRQYVDSLNINIDVVTSFEKIPFLPISFFKTHAVKTTEFVPEIIFESSGTTGSINSRHYLKDTNLYIKSFSKAFELFYGNENDWCILAVLPSYLERENSSLVFMAESLIKKSENRYSGFYLDDDTKLYQTIMHNEILKQPTLLIGVTFALLDFVEKYTMKLKYTVIMETGGMKGRRKEIIRNEIHKKIQDSLGVKKVHSEYGMTELLSQAYSIGDGLFKCPPWMKILLRQQDDPLSLKTITYKKTSGLINVIDLANIYSCAFIATDDIGVLHKNDHFEVLGRYDNTDVRGCSLLTINGSN